MYIRLNSHKDIVRELKVDFFVSLNPFKHFRNDSQKSGNPISETLCILKIPGKHARTVYWVQSQSLFSK